MHAYRLRRVEAVDWQQARQQELQAAAAHGEPVERLQSQLNSDFGAHLLAHDKQLDAILDLLATMHMALAEPHERLDALERAGRPAA